MDTHAYLRRIDYTGSLSPTAESLRQLQVAHLLTVPFENLSIHWGEPIVLDDNSLFEKIVVRRRGGFCYELNGLFAALLRELGFEVIMLSAEVASPEGVFGPEFDHMALLVSLRECWLVDVGFGDSFREPLLLDTEDDQLQGDRAYRVIKEKDRLTVFQRDADAEWKAQYRFGLQPHTYSDYAEMCHYHQTSPQSHFTRQRICSLATPVGRLTLSDKRLITTFKGGVREERLLNNEKEYLEVLREFFGIESSLT
jgi:N-hydroxyarylamine O-acetyltransferase